MRSARWPQYVAGLASAMGAFVAGSGLGWSSPVGTRLDQLKFSLSTDEFSWIASIITLGCALSCLPIGYLMDKFGRKRTMLGLIVPFLTGWGLILFAQNFSMLLIGRFVIGLSGGAFCISAPQYSSEIAEVEIRGTLGSFFELFTNSGILFTYIVGAFASVNVLTIACATLPLVFGLIFVIMPESPIYLIERNKFEEAEKSYKWLRGENFNYNIEIEIFKEKQINSSGKRSFLEYFKEKSVVRATIIGFGLGIFQQFAGINIVIFYTTQIFEEAKVELDPDISTIIVGVMNLVGNLTASQVVDKAGRKILLLISVSSMAVCLMLLGVFFYMKNNDEMSVSSLGWLPVTSLSVYIVSFAIGFGPVPWIIISEIYKDEMKAVLSPLSGSINWISAFVVTNTFQPLTKLLQIGPTFWLFSSFAGLGILFVLFIIPETKNKTKQEIQEFLER